ncbi:MFS transporter [Actinomadura kijaniata]|uniref:MFS transporter n=1 Tax=Actinomadura kijaniata TaxID=46161 RepID=UPI003F1D9C58
MSTTTSPAPPVDRLGARDLLVLLTLCGATFMTGLDYSIVTVALPSIGRDLGFSSPGALQWVATACVLPTAALLPLCGRLSDLVGRRRLFTGGVAAFTAASLAAALAVSPAALVAARVAQGVAAAAIGATAIALLTAVFPEGPRRTRALGVNGAVLSLGFVTGTIGGGVVTTGLDWRWTMLLLVLIGAAALAGAALLPRDGDRTAARLDVPGAVLASGGLFALVYAVSTGAHAGWAAVAAVALGAFLLVEARHPAPLVPLPLLARPTVKWSLLLGLVTFGMCGGATLLLSLYLQEVLGWSPLETGFGLLAEGVAALAAGGAAGRLVTARGAAFTLVVGLLTQAAGTAAMALLPARGDLPLLPARGDLPLLLGASAALGFGHVLAVVAFTTALTSGLRDDERGVAGSLAQTPQFVGSVGVAALAALAGARGGLAGLHAAFLAAGLVTLAGVPVAAFLLPRATGRR